MAFLFDGILVLSLLTSLLVAALTLFVPCVPPLLTSLICRPANSNGYKVRWTYGPVAKMGFAMLEFVQFQVAVTGGIYYVIYFLTPAISRLWLDCKALSESGKSFENQVISYRRVQIYEKTLNSCIRDRIFLTLALLGPLFQVVSGFALIELANTPNYSTLVVCGMLYFAMLCLTLACFSAAGQVNQITVNWITGRRVICKTRVNRKTLKSFVSARIQFGTNFVERLTPLVVQQFCVQETVSLILMRS